MIRSSLAAKALGLALIIAGSVACGDNPPPKQPDTVPMATDGGSDMPTSSAMDSADASAPAKAETPPPPPPPAVLALPSASAKLKFKEKRAFDLELKSDGSVSNGGKPAAKVTGMELQDKDGKTALKVADDGAISGFDGSPYAKFEGDDLVSQTSTKYSIGDDGALTSVNEKGTKANLGKTEGVGSAKRASLLVVAYSIWGNKPPAAKAMADKPAGDKKPAGGDKKPMPKKP